MQGFRIPMMRSTASPRSPPTRRPPLRSAIIGLAVLASLSVTTGRVPAQTTDLSSAYVGVWYDQTKEGAIAIKKCGNQLCGEIFWYQRTFAIKMFEITGPVKDKKGRTICGLEAVKGLTPQGDGSWDKGRIYDPKTDAEYDMNIKTLSGTTLEVTVYIAGQTKYPPTVVTWTKAPGDLKHC